MARDGTEWETKEDKICTQCNIQKPYDSFQINQYGKNNRILRRPVCKECYDKKIKLSSKDIKEYEKKYPRTKIGDYFFCPVCAKNKEHKFNNDICLDHNHETGEIRGYLCGSCNASIGKFHENIENLERAIKWLKGELKND
tara:strand:- start:123 stop:545 length:423 start_codon:yes stop_codon:yes gene_type:complete